jgi:glycosyltransferase involved in cell wall biosynthesis
MGFTGAKPVTGAEPVTSAPAVDRARGLTILHVIFSAGPTSSQLNEHCLPLAGKHRIGVCSFQPASASVPPEISLHEGDGTLRGFLRALNAALAEDRHDVVHVHGQPLAAVMLLSHLLKRRSMRGCVFTIHNSYRSYRWRDRLLLYPIAARFPRVVACSAAVAHSLPSSLKRVAGHRLSAVPNGVDLDRVDSVCGARPARSADARFTVASAGRLIPRKDPLAVLGAFRELREADLIFIGSGELEDRVRASAQDLGPGSRIEVTGLVGREDVYRHFARADVFISCSWGEGLPVAVLEAMACRLPVILSDIPPHREVADGLDVVPLVAPGDVAGFAEHLRRFALMEPAERAAIGERCRRHVEERFGLAAMHAGYARVYAEAMQA